MCLDCRRAELEKKIKSGEEFVSINVGFSEQSILLEMSRDICAIQKLLEHLIGAKIVEGKLVDMEEDK